MSRRRFPYEDEDDDPPRRRPHDDDGDDRPIGRTSRKRVSPVAILGLAAGAFVLLLVVGVVIYLLARSASKPASIDLLAHVPADATVVAGYDMDDLENNETYRKALERQPLPDVVELDQAGVRPSELSRFVVARTPNGNACAMSFKSAPARSKYLGPDVVGKTYGTFTSLTSSYKFGYFADANTLVLADREPTIQALKDKGGKVRLTSELKDLTDRVRGPAWRASGRVAATELGRNNFVDASLARRAGATAGTVIWLELAGSFANLKLELRFDSTEQARIGANTLRGLLVQQRGVATEFGAFPGQRGNDPSDFNDIRNGYDTAVVNESGSRVSARLRVPATEALRVFGSGQN